MAIVTHRGVLNEWVWVLVGIFRKNLDHRDGYLPKTTINHFAFVRMRGHEQKRKMVQHGHWYRYRDFANFILEAFDW